MKLLETNLSKSEGQHYLAGILPYNAALYVVRQSYIFASTAGSVSQETIQASIERQSKS